MKIGIAGLGVIGGSVAKAIKEKTTGNEIIAFDPDKKVIELALDQKVISKGSFTSADFLKGSDIIFACMPVNRIPLFIRELDDKKALFTDVGSTKAEIMELIPEEIRFIGGHPLTGSEKTGFAGSSAALFENAAYVLCKGKNTAEGDFLLLKEFVSTIGAIPLEMTAEQHDKTVAFISHIPHIAAVSLVNIVDDLHDDTAKKLCAGGFKDITRIASSNPELWREILLSGGSAVVDALDTYIKALASIRDSLAERDGNTVRDTFAKSKEFRDGITDNICGLLPSVYEIWVDVPDKPGIIGNIATFLGNEGINIKNIVIQNNRDFEGGCLRIGLAGEKDVEHAVKKLTAKGYNAGRKM